MFAKRYALHVEHGFPNFTIKNCEACHKAVLINEDDEARLASFNSHVDMGGYNVENDTANTYVYKMIDRIMTYFK